MTRTHSYHRLYSLDAEDLEKYVVGQRIQSVHGDTITLDNGIELEFETGGDCCAWFEAELSTLIESDHAVTAVREEDCEEIACTTCQEAGVVEHWRLSILAFTTEILAVDITGDPTTGYYGTSVDLRVALPKDLM